MSKPERYESILRLAWKVGWARARLAYVEREQRFGGRDGDALWREVQQFDRLYHQQAVDGVDPVLALHRRDLERLIVRPAAAVLGLGVALLSAAAGFDMVATLVNAGLTFALSDMAARGLVRLALR